MVWGRLGLINREALSENCKLFQTRLYKYNQPGYTSITCSQISNIPCNLISSTKFNDSSILITNISCYYLNLALVNEYVGDITIPTKVIKYNQNFHQADQSIRLQYSNQIKLYMNIKTWSWIHNRKSSNNSPLDQYKFSYQNQP